MAFLSKASSLWRSLLSIDEPAFEAGGEATLDDASAIQRYFNEEENVRPALMGVLSIKIISTTLKPGRHHRILTGFCNKACQISIRNLVKRTRVVSSNRQGTVVWDQIKHFPVKVVRNRRHPYNLVNVCVLGLRSDEPEAQSELGSIAFHLHDVIKSSPVSGFYDLWKGNDLVGEIHLELTFNYGFFGYGYSSQLREEEIKPEDLVQYSLFPRINPRREFCEPGENIMVARAMPHPSFIDFKNKVALSYGGEILDLLKEMEAEIYSPEQLVKQLTPTAKVRDQYYSSGDRVARLINLHNLLEKSMHNTEAIAEGEEAWAEDALPPKMYTQFVHPNSHEVRPRDNIISALLGGNILKTKEFSSDELADKRK